MGHIITQPETPDAKYHPTDGRRRSQPQPSWLVSQLILLLHLTLTITCKFSYASRCLPVGKWHRLNCKSILVDSDVSNYKRTLHNFVKILSTTALAYRTAHRCELHMSCKTVHFTNRGGGVQTPNTPK